MDFRFSEEQELFRKSVRDFVNRELPKSWARELEKDEHQFPHEPRQVKTPGRKEVRPWKPCSDGPAGPVVIP